MESEVTSRILDVSSGQPRLYDDLSWLWRYVSPPEHYVEEVKALHRLLQRYGVREGGTVLHLGSGGGSVDVHLQQHYRVTGVDRSVGMIENARRVNPAGEYLLGDIRDVSLGRSFDAVVSHDAIAYQTTPDDLAAVYRTAARHLKPGAVLIAFPEQVRSQYEDGQASVRTITDDVRSVTTLEVAHDVEPNDTIFQRTFVYVIREGREVRTLVDTHLMGIFDLDVFVDAVRRAGFDVTVEACELSDLDHEYTVIIGKRI
jgi:SAM-dependent methyltransferase